MMYVIFYNIYASIHRSLDSSPRWWWLFPKSQKLARIFQSPQICAISVWETDEDIWCWLPTSYFCSFWCWTAYLPSKSDPCAICACWSRNKNLNSSPTAMLRPENLNWKGSPGRRGFRGPPTEKEISGRNITSWKFGLVILKKFSMIGANCAFRGPFPGQENSSVKSRR